MSDDLRKRCIIAMRDVIGGYAYDHLGNPEFPFEGATAARLALDAMLDCLTENLTETVQIQDDGSLSYPMALEDLYAEQFLAVLRERQ